MGNGMNKVLPGLFVGNYRDSKDPSQLERHKITHIIAIHDAARRLHPDKEYLCIMASDSPYQNLTQYFPTCNDFIHSARIEGGNVLIHCLAGMSRSVTIAVAYIMSITSLRWNEALKAVRGARAVSNPNSGFQKQLQEFESTKLLEERRRLIEKFPGTTYLDSDEEHCKRLLVSYNNLLLSRAICEGGCTSARVCPTGTCRSHYSSQRLTRQKSTERSLVDQRFSGSSKSLDSASTSSSSGPSSPQGSPNNWERHYGCWKNHRQKPGSSNSSSNSAPGSPILYRVGKSQPQRTDSMSSITSMGSVTSLPGQLQDREPCFVPYMSSNHVLSQSQSCPNSPRRMPKKLPRAVLRDGSSLVSQVSSSPSIATATTPKSVTSSGMSSSGSPWAKPTGAACLRLQAHHSSPSRTTTSTSTTNIAGTTRWVMKRSAYRYNMDGS